MWIESVGRESGSSRKRKTTNETFHKPPALLVVNLVVPEALTVPNMSTLAEVESLIRSQRERLSRAVPPRLLNR